MHTTFSSLQVEEQQNSGKQMQNEFRVPAPRQISSGGTDPSLATIALLE